MRAASLRAETDNPGRAHGVATQAPAAPRTDDDQVGGHLAGQRDDTLTGSDVDVMLLGQPGVRVAGAMISPVTCGSLLSANSRHVHGHRNRSPERARNVTLAGRVGRDTVGAAGFRAHDTRLGPHRQRGWRDLFVFAHYRCATAADDGLGNCRRACRGDRRSLASGKAAGLLPAGQIFGTHLAIARDRLSLPRCLQRGDAGHNGFDNENTF